MSIKNVLFEYTMIPKSLGTILNSIKGDINY